ncbi:HIT family protein [Histidinibacterium aquaticum]|uniref:HIT domain-containing protein n=1 Tax=Histidinibacterium aquaticum TaxID=2613962 RepID=A0A5J5GIM7_9RHOB|nr:HIT domain-containing protein [Histidinibacterium aquaticum]KAA9008099.1 hypothetical protein F3S47_11370 [Histidinibacterium aquaticum]
MKASSEKFAWVANGTPRPRNEHVVRETERFIVVPTIGALVEGWLLVIPKRRLENFSLLVRPERDELTELLGELSVKLARYPGQLHLFEHGGPKGSLVSCGVDQAHLHVVPLQFSLLDEALAKTDVNWSSAPRIEELRPQLAQHEYLYAWSAGNGISGTLKHPKSQWFRKLIAQRLGRCDEWNYREFPHYEVADQTAKEVAG